MVLVLKNEYKLNQFIIEVEKDIRKRTFENQYYYENQYLHKHNHTCPLCKKTIKTNFNKILTGAGLVGFIQLKQEKAAISYTLCKKCSKNIARETNARKKESELEIASHILSTIN